MNIGLGIGIPFNRSQIWLSLFDPSKLFTAGVNGAWYDPSDINLTWRRNLLTYSEQFDNAAWSKMNVTVTANAAVAPDGTTTAALLRPIATSGTGTVAAQNQTISGDIGTYAASYRIKSSGFNWAIVAVRNIAGNRYVWQWFDLANGVVGSRQSSSFSFVSATIELDAQGFHICTLRVTTNIADSGLSSFVGMSDANNNLTATASGTNGIYIWGAQLEVGSTATPYQRITDGIQDYLQYQAQPVLYRDAAGTLPVTAVEQPVGLMLDKSKQLVLGPELVTNGGFDTDTDWVKGTGWTIDGGVATFTNPGFASPITQNILTANKYYRLTFTVSGASINVRPYFGTYTGSQFYTAAGTYTVNFQAGSEVAFGFQGVSGAAFSIDNISVRELPGNHAFNSSGNSANFPVLSARYNLLTKTEQFDDAVWTKTGIKAFGSGSITNTTAVADPNGANTVDFICEDTSAGPHAVSQQYSTQIPAGTKMTGRIAIAKYGFANSRRWAYVSLALGSNASVSERYVVIVDLDPSAGSVTDSKIGANISNQSVSVTSSGNFWVVALSAQSNTTGTVNYIVCGASNSATPSYAAHNDVTYTGDGTSGIYLWGADLRVANDALNQPAYQRVNTSTDYDTVGFKPYLRFNGVSQWLQTNSIDFSYGDKMFVCAGVRKLSDAVVAILTELSANADNANGGFNLGAPVTTLHYYISHRQTSLATRGITDASYTSPISNVLTAEYEFTGVAGTELKLRINANQKSFNISTGAASTGTYGNYPLYIGARAGTSLWFNGRLYGMVVAGKQASAAEIQDTEKYMNLKTAAYN